MNMGFNVVICPPCGEKVGSPTKKRGAHKVCLIGPLLPRLTAVLPPQGREICRGFTLIELLVVVLIIGILAAVALPQYQKAVMKSRMTNVVLFVNNAQKALEVWKLSHDIPYAGYESMLEMLDIDLTKAMSCTNAACTDGFLTYGITATGMWDGPEAYFSIFVTTEDTTPPSIGIFVEQYVNGRTDKVCSYRGAKGKMACDTLQTLDHAYRVSSY